MTDIEKLNIIASEIKHKTFDEYGGFIGLYERFIKEGISDLSDSLNYVLAKTRKLKTEA
jgi:hypothetical protein